MQRRIAGHTNLEVPVIMLGGNVFGWTVSEADSFRLLDQAFDAGLNLIDTADVYSRWAPGHTGGESETIIGKWFARSGKRDRVVIATKAGMDMGDGKSGLKPAYLQQALDDSLRRLQTDRIDLYQSHKDDESTPLEDTLGAYGRMIEQGKVRYIGASNYTGARLKEALEISRANHLPAYQTLQPLYNLVERQAYESDLAPVMAEYGLGVIPYYALASGFLSGKYRSESDLAGKARGRGAGKYLNERGLAVLNALDEVARQYNSTPAAVALAWLIAQPGITAPIASATNSSQLDALIAATNLTLDAASLQKLSDVSSPRA
ncbi:MAG TPA: aldo/keto reductase [Bryobacteraceae bacterium]|jgi:aryl-alcohol dehydrogenase-like predicted oxidoreductase|nr:aldo/keto reductase [Bryobacteraceae bacterium]